MIWKLSNKAESLFLAKCKTMHAQPKDKKVKKFFMAWMIEKLDNIFFN